MKTKNKYKQLIVLLLFAIGLVSACKKNAEVCVDGQVLNVNDNSPVAGALVRITGYEGSYLGSTSTYVVDETTTDSEGKYSFKYKEKNKFSYRVSTSHPKYFFDQRQSEIVLSSNANQKANLSLIPEAWVKLYAKRVSGAYRCLFGGAEIETTDISGIEKFITKYRSQGGDFKFQYLVSYNINGSNVDSVKNINFYFKPFDTTSIHVEW
jgi:hypothetical protein